MKPDDTNDDQAAYEADLRDPSSPNYDADYDGIMILAEMQQDAWEQLQADNRDHEREQAGRDEDGCWGDD